MTVLTPSKRFNGMCVDVHAEASLTPSKRSNVLSKQVDLSMRFDVHADADLTPSSRFDHADALSEPLTPTPSACTPTTIDSAQPALASLPFREAASVLTLDNLVDVLAWRSSSSLPLFCMMHVVLLAASAASATSLMNHGAKITIVGVAFGFVKRHVLGTAPTLEAITADDIALMARPLLAVANGTVQLANKILLAQDLRLAILTVSALWAFTIAASVMSVGTMAYAFSTLAFGAAPFYRLCHTQIAQVRDLARREAQRLVLALSFKHILGLTLGALTGWLFVGIWTKFVLSLLLPMALKLYRATAFEEVSVNLARMHKKVPRRLSIGAGALGRIVVQGARMATDIIRSPARPKVASKRE
ncbi:hypothetical protein T492DRAFT_939887 [Pavlovales sp. CCMP2436]|nr:hypothetical protein T492DRAFT_939887 [Pavlovales sp. CCMP2436]